MDGLSSPRKKVKLTHPEPGQHQADNTVAMSDNGSESAVNGAIVIDTKANNEDPDTQLRKELDVGISEFVSPELPGFDGLLKKR